jgi:hypothetical protein
MTVAAIQYPYAGSQVLGNFSSSIEVADNDTSYKPIIPVGTIVNFNDPYYGSGTAIRLCVPKNTTAIKVGTLSTWAAATNAGFASNYSFVILPVTANLSKPVAVAINAVPNNASFAQYAWFALSGTLPVWSLAATAVAAPLFISATAGAAFVTLTAGRQLVGMCPVVAATGTVVKAGSGQSGAFTIKVANTDGLFVGQVGSGTGVGTNTIITDLSADGTTVTVSVANSANISGNVTFTNNDATNFFPIVQFNNPFAQGNVT